MGGKVRMAVRDPDPPRAMEKTKRTCYLQGQDMAANESGGGQTELVIYGTILSKRRTKAFVSIDKLNTVIITTLH